MASWKKHAGNLNKLGHCPLKLYMFEAFSGATAMAGVLQVHDW